jgi:hypothetical protein
MDLAVLKAAGFEPDDFTEEKNMGKEEGAV